MGVSLGGYIAQYFAADYPDYVKQLIVASAAYRVSDEGRKAPEHWLALARENRWSEFYRDIARVTLAEYHGVFSRLLAPLIRQPECHPDDFLVSLEASLLHDGREVLPLIHVPTLLIGGTKDIFFPPSMLQETAQSIPRVILRYIEGGGHSVSALRRREFENILMDFLHREDAVVAGGPNTATDIAEEALAA